ncbi:MAG TPA: helix-turn-helix domain-containing protein [Dehalococcoidia bacterium]|nr:helix-turn-helix domain-containing protein [Dehalococcoidia bacterium]
MSNFVEEGPFCPVYHNAIELIGRRWTGVVLRALMSDVHRFSDLTGVIPGLSDRMLAARLNELQREGLVVRRIFPETPVRIEYHLTEKGQALARVVQEISDWAGEWLGDPDHAATHAGAAPAQPITS